MAQIMSDLENNHTGRKLSTMAIRLGFLIEIFSYNYLLKLFIRIPIQILIFLSAMLTLSLGHLWLPEQTCLSFVLSAATATTMPQNNNMIG